MCGPHTWNEGDCVFSAILGGLENIGLYVCVCYSRSARISMHELNVVHLDRIGVYGCAETLVAARSKDCDLLAIESVLFVLRIYLRTASWTSERHAVYESVRY